MSAARTAHQRILNSLGTFEGMGPKGSRCGILPPAVGVIDESGWLAASTPSLVEVAVSVVGVLEISVARNSVIAGSRPLNPALAKRVMEREPSSRAFAIVTSGVSPVATVAGALLALGLISGLFVLTLLLPTPEIFAPCEIDWMIFFSASNEPVVSLPSVRAIRM